MKVIDINNELPIFEKNNVSASNLLVHCSLVLRLHFDTLMLIIDVNVTAMNE